MDVEPKIGEINPPKWMVKIMENPTKMDDLGGKPILVQHPYATTRIDHMPRLVVMIHRELCIPCIAEKMMPRCGYPNV